MDAIVQLFDRIVREEDGQDMIEYALLAALLAVAAVTALIALGPKVSGVFTSVDGDLPT
jgi:pilus assembly protein Flp/PilA